VVVHRFRHSPSRIPPLGRHWMMVRRAQMCGRCYHWLQGRSSYSVIFGMHTLTACSPHFACWNSDEGQQRGSVATRGGVGCKGHEGIDKYVVRWRHQPTTDSDQSHVLCLVLVLFVSCRCTLLFVSPCISYCNNHCRDVWFFGSPSMKFRWGCPL
jgi:hypothetical protein